MGHDLHLPAAGRATAAALVLHPHPARGGNRHHPLVVAVAEGLAGGGVAALRLDLPDPDVAVSASALVDATEGLLAEVGTARLLLVGYSWGSAVASLAAPTGLVARVLVAPPVHSFAFADPTPVPALALVPVHDQYGGPDAVRAAMGAWASTTVEVVEGCDHFLAGAVSRIADRAVAWLGERT